MGHTKYIRVIFPFSVGFRTNEALCQLIYEATYLGPEGDRPGRPTQAVRHTCSGNLRIVEILRCFRSDKFKIPPHKQKSVVKNFFWKEDIPPGQRGPVLKQMQTVPDLPLCLSTMVNPELFAFVVDTKVVIKSINICSCLNISFSLVVVSVLASSALDRGSYIGRVKPKTRKLLPFSARHATLRSMSKDWLVQNRDNVSEQCDMSICRLLFPCSSSIKIQLTTKLTSSKCIQLKIDHLALNNNHYRLLDITGKQFRVNLCIFVFVLLTKPKGPSECVPVLGLCRLL